MTKKLKEEREIAEKLNEFIASVYVVAVAGHTPIRTAFFRNNV